MFGFKISVIHLQLKKISNFENIFSIFYDFVKPSMLCFYAKCFIYLYIFSSFH